ncbi:bifunctional DNA-formamidopyrimidine glycosylase/DNA-(apurinic or apyrimidinic site) lyase [Gemmatimonadota bacterium]
MPELPEVETVRRELEAGSARRGPSPIGKRIEKVVVSAPEVIGLPGSVDAFVERLAGRTIERIGRRGKYLIVHLSEGDLVVHLRMSGDLRVRSADAVRGDEVRDAGPGGTAVVRDAADGGADVDRTAETGEENVVQAAGNEKTAPPPRVWLTLEDGSELQFHSTRKLSRIYAADHHDEVTGDLGPEPLDDSFGPADLAALLYRSTRNLKSFLLDQHLIAGVGNIYASEILFAARLHPDRLAGSLNTAEVEALWQSMRSVFGDAVEAAGTSIDYAYEGGGYQDRLQVYGFEGEPCPACGMAITRIVQNARSTYCCPNCQQ